MKKLFDVTGDAKLYNVIRSLLSNRMFHVTLNNRKSRWVHQTNGLPQGSALAPLLFSVYTTDQPLPEGCSRFIYADNLETAMQQCTFPEVEATTCVQTPGKPISAASILRTEKPNGNLTLWDGIKLENHQHPVYLRLTLDRTLSYREHPRTRAKVSTRNRLLRQLTNLKWGAHPGTLRTSALALCFSVAEYACPVWSRSCHAQKLNPILKETCRRVTGCFKTTPAHCLYALSGMAPPDIRRAVITQVERKKQAEDIQHLLHGHSPTQKRRCSKKSFLDNT